MDLKNACKIIKDKAPLTMFDDFARIFYLKFYFNQIRPKIKK
jgi:hypothetical protein